MHDIRTSVKDFPCSLFGKCILKCNFERVLGRLLTRIIKITRITRISMISRISWISTISRISSNNRDLHGLRDFPNLQQICRLSRVSMISRFLSRWKTVENQIPEIVQTQYRKTQKQQAQPTQSLVYDISCDL